MVDVPLITMPAEQAKEKLKAFRKACHQDAEQEYELATRLYHQLAKGLPLLRLSEAIRGAGFTDKWQPRLAIARADRRQVRFAWEGWNESIDFDSQLTSTGRRIASMNTRVHVGARHNVTRQQRDGTTFRPTICGWALVPLVPADVRPERGQLKDWHILWEVEAWSERPFRAEPDRDPLLLKHIAGDLYAVLAEWDLTDCERAVMAEVLRAERGG